MTTRAILITVLTAAMLGGCGGDGSTTTDGGADVLEQDGWQDAGKDSSPSDQLDTSPTPDQPPAQDTAPPDSPPADEGGVDVARDVAEDAALDMAADVQPADMQPADVPPDAPSLPPNSYTCRTLTGGQPSVRAVNGETLRVDCDNASLDEAVCELTDGGHQHCFLCVRCDQPPEPFCSQQPTVRLLTYDLACTGTGDEFCLYEERPVSCTTCENSTCS